MKWYSAVLFALFFIVFLVVPEAVVAESATLEDRGVVSGEPTPAGGIVPAGLDNYSPDGYGSCEFVELVNNVLQFLIGLSALLAVIVFIYAGYLMVSSRGDVGQIQQAKGLFANVAIGFVLMLSAFLIINTILSIMVGSGSGILNWQTIECSYAFESGDPEDYKIVLSSYDPDWIVVAPGGITASSSVGDTAGGTCSVVSNTANACHPNKLGCFGARADDASQICNIESGGGNIKAVSGTDLCKDKASFSGGLFQINILAHYGSIPGCTNDFFQKTGSGTQGDCLRYAGPSDNPYCAIRNCEIVKDDVYRTCMNALFDPSFNINKACSLYNSDGKAFGDWDYSANKCSIN